MKHLLIALFACVMAVGQTVPTPLPGDPLRIPPQGSITPAAVTGARICTISSSSATAYVGATSPAMSTYPAGVEVRFTANQTSGAAPTLNCGGGALAIRDALASAAIPTGFMESGYVYTVRSNGTYWLMQEPAPGAAGQKFLSNVSVGTTGLHPEGNTITIAALGAADEGQINTAITTLNAAGGGTLYLSPGNGRYVLTAGQSIVLKNYVKIHGQTPNLDWGDAPSNDYWGFGTGGTVISGSGAPCIKANNVALANPGLYTAASALVGVEIDGIGLTGCTRGIDVGADNASGLYYSTVKNVYVSGTTDWGLHFQNFSLSRFERLYSVNNTVGDMYFGAAIATATYMPGNSQFELLYSSPTGRTTRGIVFAAAPVAGALVQMNAIEGNYIQINRFRDTLYQQTVTPANGSSTISVPELTGLAVGMPVYFTTTASGFTLNRQYFVLSMSGASGAGTITVGLSKTAPTAVNGADTTTLVMRSYGHPGIEIIGDAATSSKVVSSHFRGIDIESTAPGVYLDYTAAVNLQITSQALGGISGLVGRHAETTLVDTANIIRSDFDGTSFVTWQGPINEIYNTRPYGVRYDNTLGVFGLSLTGSQSGNGFDLWASAPGAYFIAAGKEVGHHVINWDTTVGMNASFCGVVVFNGAAAQTLTLPTIDNGSTLNTYLGCPYIIVNASANTLNVATDGTQTYNNVAGKTTTTLAANATLSLIAVKGGAAIFWQATYVPASALP